MDLLNNKMQEIPGVVATETLISLEPVSYTHLDVYKRQTYRQTLGGLIPGLSGINS